MIKIMSNPYTARVLFLLTSIGGNPPPAPQSSIPRCETLEVLEAGGVRLIPVFIVVTLAGRFDSSTSAWF